MMHWCGSSGMADITSRGWGTVPRPPPIQPLPPLCLPPPLQQLAHTYEHISQVRRDFPNIWLLSYVLQAHVAKSKLGMETASLCILFWWWESLRRLFLTHPLQKHTLTSDLNAWWYQCNSQAWARPLPVAAKSPEHKFVLKIFGCFCSQDPLSASCFHFLFLAFCAYWFM